MSTTLSIDICICTFQRPQLAETLVSITAQQIPQNWHIRVIVADNDESPSAKILVDSYRAKIPFPLVYLHAPARNISIARNACLDATTAELIAFIDDDEVATPGWLAALVSALNAQHADVALGPVQALYDPTAPEWLRKGDFHSTLPVWVKGRIITGYTCNALLRREIVMRLGLRFDPALGRTGGEDTLFFMTLTKGGGCITYAGNALVTEHVPPSRALFSWRLKRSFRSGQTHGRLLRQASKLSLLQIITAAVKAGFCLLMATFHGFMTIGGRRWLLRGTLHCGVIAALCGIEELKQYG